MGDSTITDSNSQRPPQTPADLQAYIDQHAIRARLLDGIGGTPTVPAAAAALGVKTAQIIKTLLFLIERVNESDRSVQPVVVISNGESRVDKRPLADHFGVGKKRVKLAPADVVLDLLGYPAGGVPPFGHRTKVPALIDAELLAAQPEHKALYGGGGDEGTMLEITLAELLRVVQPEVLNLTSA